MRHFLPLRRQWVGAALGGRQGRKGEMREVTRRHRGAEDASPARARGHRLRRRAAAGLLAAAAGVAVAVAAVEAAPAPLTTLAASVTPQQPAGTHTPKPSRTPKPTPT